MTKSSNISRRQHKITGRSVSRSIQYRTQAFGFSHTYRAIVHACAIVSMLLLSLTCYELHNVYFREGQKMTISRRKLIQNSSASVAGVAGLSLTVAAAQPGATPESVTSESIIWDDEVDVVVVGSGASAATAAITAHDAGAEVMILEKAGNPGGTSLLASGFSAFNNPKMREIGLEDPREDALRFMSRYGYPSLYDPELDHYGIPESNYALLEAFYDNSSPSVEFLERIGALYTTLTPGGIYSEVPEAGPPEHYAGMPENKAPYGRGLVGTADDPSKAHFQRQLLAYIEGQQIPLRTGHQVTAVHQNSHDEVIGVTAATDTGEVFIRARKGVIFGSGGFTQNPEKALNYVRGPIFGGCGVPTNTGDFVDIGISAGTKLGNMNNAFFVQMVLEAVLRSPSTTFDVWMPWGDSMVMVNKYGQRVVNEKMSYHDRTQSHFYWNPSRREFSNQILYMIWDSAVAERPEEWLFRFPIPMPGEEPDYLIKGDTWDELIDNINARLETVAGQGTVSARVPNGYQLADDFADTFTNTINTFNQYAENGEDPEFQRGEIPIELAWGVGIPREEGMKNPTMAPFKESGPYYCVMVGPGTMDTNGGPVTTPKAEVVNTKDEPIPGLYGAGNCISAPTGMAYFSTVGPAMTYGYIAGTEAAASNEHSPD